MFLETARRVGRYDELVSMSYNFRLTVLLVFTT